jgi:glycyl-tRNA synthetase alpha chain
VEFSRYNFEEADTEKLLHAFNESEKESKRLLDKQLPLPAYEMAMQASHLFNLLDARRAISVTERQRYILRIRELVKAVSKIYYERREALGFPLVQGT